MEELIKAILGGKKITLTIGISLDNDATPKSEPVEAATKKVTKQKVAKPAAASEESQAGKSSEEPSPGSGYVGESTSDREPAGAEALPDDKFEDDDEW